MTGNLSTDILVIYLPAVLAIVMGIIGLLRGTRREVLVSAAIVLASLITLVWGAPWATDIHDMMTKFSAVDIRNVLVYVVMGLTVLVVGYLLGSALVPRTPISAWSRIGGLVLGIANGLAIGGYFIRSQYESAQLDPSGSNVDLINAITTNGISRSIWIWSNWFPLAVAIIAAIVAIIGPFRRVQTVVATPATATNWGPSAASSIGTTAATPIIPTAPVSVPGPAAYTTGYGQGYTGQYPQQQQPQQYGNQNQYSPQPNQPNQPYTPPNRAYSPYGSAPQPTPPAFGGSNSGSSNTSSYPSIAPVPARAQDAPPTMPMPASDLPRSTPVGGQETHYFGTGGSTSPSASTPSSSSLSGSSSSSTPSAATPSASPEWSTYGNEPSWLTSPSKTPSSTQLPTESLPLSTSSSAGGSTPVDSSLVARSEAPTQAQAIPDLSIPELPAPVEDKPVLLSTPITPVSIDVSSFRTTTVDCPHCGKTVPADATFCTECGYRLKA